MAGGMTGRGALPVAVRFRGGGGASSGPSDDETPGRHCWVADPTDDVAGRRAGLLVEWRRAAGGGWEGRVVYVAQVRPGRWAVVEEWVDEAMLVPA